MQNEFNVYAADNGKADKQLKFIFKVKDYLCDISAVVLYAVGAAKIGNLIGMSDGSMLMFTGFSALSALGVIVVLNILRKNNK